MKKYLPAGFCGRKICEPLHGGQEEKHRYNTNADGQGGYAVQNPVGKVTGFSGVGVGIAFHGTGRIITVNSSSFHMDFLLGFIFVLIIHG